MDRERLKQLLGLDSSSSGEEIPEEPGSSSSVDNILDFILADVEEVIKNYCNVEEMPEGLEQTAYRMAVDLYRNENIGQEESASGPVSSLTEGDTSVSFRQYADEHFKDTVLKSYKPVLNRYRRIVF